MSHNEWRYPERYLTFVIELSDLPGIGLNRVILKRTAYSNLGASAHGDYVFPLLGQRVAAKAHAWNQVSTRQPRLQPDPIWLRVNSSYPDRLGSSSFVVADRYAILTAALTTAGVSTTCQQVPLEGRRHPALRCRVNDSSAGGSGAQRWSKPPRHGHAPPNPGSDDLQHPAADSPPTARSGAADVPAE